jgi:hypothetical protein
MIQNLRSGVNGKVREAIPQSIARILVGVYGTLTIEAKPGGLLGLERHPDDLGIRDELAVGDFETFAVAGKRWKLVTTRERICLR